MWRIIKKILTFIITVLFLCLIGIILLGLYYIKDIPDPQQILKGGFKESTKIYDRTGNVLLYQIGEERREVIDINQLPSYVKWATISAEDAEFYYHPGIDAMAILRSIWADIRHQALVQGGSTITQQFVKNAILSPEKTFSRKIKEIALSIWLELRFSKDQILGFYLNQIPYGSNAYGIESASRNFFNKSSQDLTLGQASLLSALPQRPTYLSPFGQHKNELKSRQEYILDRMASAGYITKDQAKKAKEEQIAFHAGGGTILAPHFVFYIKEYLEKVYGPERVEQGGLRVITTLDWRLQQKAQEILTAQAKKNEKKYHANNSALVALDPKTGQILSMVGSRDWFDDAIDGKVNVALRLRQPGSSFKPIVYSKLFERGFGAESLIFDLKTTFRTRAGQHYTPRNFTGKFHGLVNMRTALGQSLNIPAIKSLYLVGIPDTIALAKQMGITSINPDRVDLALVLGGAEVRPLDFTGAYSVFASGGVYNPPVGILKVEDKDGKSLEEYVSNPTHVLDPEITGLITSILSDNETRAPLFGANSPLFTPGIASAAKTGTTTDFRDGWTMGYTPNLVVGVWAGNNNNAPTVNGEGAYIAGPIWNQLITFAAKTFPDEFGGTFPDPLPHKLLDIPMANGSLAADKIVSVDKTSGKLATDLTPPSLIEQRTFKEVHSLLYYYRPDDPQLDAWEAPVKEWVSTHTSAELSSQFVPQEYDTSHTPQNTPVIDILSPQADATATNSLRVVLNVRTVFPLKQLEVAIDDELIKTLATTDPFDLDIATLEPGQHALTIKVFDEELNTAKQTIPFTKS